MSTIPPSVPPPNTPLDTVLELLGEVRSSGSGYAAHCPGHEDQRPSLSVTEADDGRVLLYCHAGCSTEEVVEALGLIMADLFPAPDLPSERTSSAPRIAATYDYCNEVGDLLFQALRYHPKEFKLRRRDRDGGWTWNLNGTRRVLYRLPQLLNADPSAPVFIVEGEKDANALAELGLVATTNPGGAGPKKWRPKFTEALQGRRVVIVPDNDDPGRKHAEAVARALIEVAASVTVLVLPGLPPKGDVSDWLCQRSTADELLRLATAAPEWAAARTLSPAPLRPLTISAADLLSKKFPKLRWAVPGIVPEGLSLLVGPPKIGKSRLALDLALAVAGGGTALGPRGDRRPLCVLVRCSP